jgi:hypothetical protein
MAPNTRPENSNGYNILTITSPVSVANAPNKATATRHADPIANPFPIAAVVFPAASKISVFNLAAYKSHISEIPPALSDIGPYPSIVRPIEIVESIPSAANDTPYI